MEAATLKERIKGLIHLVLTHFHDNGDLDLESLRTSIRHALKALEGQDAVFLTNGSTAEFYALSEEENQRIIETVVDEVNGAFPVITGTGRPGTRVTIEAGQRAQDAGVDGVLIVNPYYQPATEEGIFRHFSAAAQNIDIGIMIYNNPVVSQLWIPPHLMKRLSKIPNIIADKENTSSAAAYYSMQREVDGADMAIVAGLGHLMYSFEALYGCPAFVTELVNFAPEIAVSIYRASLEGDFQAMTSIVDRLTPFYDFLSRCAKARTPVPTVLSPTLSYQAMPFYQSVTKAAMELVGLPGGIVREPMENVSAAEKAELKAILLEMGVL